MDSQTITQNINIQIANSNTGGNTGSGTTNSTTSQPTSLAGKLSNTGSTPLIFISIALTIIVLSIFIWKLSKRATFKHLTTKYKANSRTLGIYVVLAFAALGWGINANLLKASASPMPPLALSVSQSNLDVTVPKGGGIAMATTSLTTRTMNPDGYKLTAQLAASEPGIAIALKGGVVTTSTPLTTSTPPLELKTTTTSTVNDTIDTTEVTLTFTIDDTVTPGIKELQLNYKITDNEAQAPPTPTTMQSMTSAYCSTMTVYDGTNEEAVLSLADNRGFTTQTYQVAKLADNKCWMLTNLKLGSTEGPITLTPADTDVVSDFTLPQVATTGTTDPDNPGVYGPVPGNTNSGATNYGYLYNWSAATAGESRTSHDETAGNAPYSICPKNWRLPTGGSGGEFSGLDIAFGGNGISADNGEPNIAKWQYTGPFKGVFAGYWWEGFGGQGVNGFLWSSSANPGNADDAMLAVFDAAGVYPFYSGNRVGGFGVRCLLNN